MIIIIESKRIITRRISKLCANYPFNCAPTPRVFGCTCFVHILRPGWNKLSAKTIINSALQKRYHSYFLDTNQYFISIDVNLCLYLKRSLFYTFMQTIYLVLKCLQLTLKFLRVNTQYHSFQLPRSSINSSTRGISRMRSFMVIQQRIFMKQPPRFTAQQKSSLVCKLCCSLYSLKRFHRAEFGLYSFVVHELTIFLMQLRSKTIRESEAETLFSIGTTLWVSALIGSLCGRHSPHITGSNQYDIQSIQIFKNTSSLISD